MKLPTIKPVASASDRLFQVSGVPNVPWSSSDDRAAAAALAADRYAARRLRAARIVARKSCESYHKTLDNLEMEETEIFLPFSPPRFKTKKDGSQVELKFRIAMLSVSAGDYSFKITPNTDPASIIKKSREIARRCGADAAARFEREAMAILPDRPAEKKPRPAVGWYVTASGKDCRRGAHTPSRWLAGAALNYKKPA
jgi:hypothetical protein